MKFSPQIHLFVCACLLLELSAPALVRAAEPNRNICARINTPKAKLDKNELEKNRRKLFSSWQNALIKDFSRQHRSLSNLSKTTKSRSAQENYLKSLTENITDICDLQLSAEQKVLELATEQNKGSGKEMCGRFEELESFYSDSNTKLDAVKGGLKQRLSNLTNLLNDKAGVNRSELDDLDKAGFKTGERAPLTTFPHSTGDNIDPTSVPETGAKPHISLREEVAIIWGAPYANSKASLEKNPKMDPNSFYGGILTRLQNEGKQLDFISGKLEEQRVKMESTKNDCVAAGNLPETATTAAAPADGSDISGTGDVNGNSPSEIAREKREADRLAALNNNGGGNDGNGGGNDGNGNSPSEIAREKREAARLLALNNNGGGNDGNGGNDGGNNGNGGNDGGNNGGNNGNGGGNDGGAEPPPVRPPVKEEGWISQNKGLLLTLGAGAAAVGGILWYKNSQDKKADKKANELEEEARALASASSASSTSTSTSTDSTFGGTPANGATPQGSKFVISGIPAGAEVGSNLTAITVAIVNPSGILTQDSNTDITVACAVPASCSLTGTLTVNTDAGKAVFNDLRFTSPDSGVKLIFSAPGFTSVTSSNAFNVTGTGGTRE